MIPTLLRKSAVSGMLLVMMAGCVAPITPAPAAQPMATPATAPIQTQAMPVMTSEPVTPEPAQVITATGTLLSGRALWGSQPVAGVRIELREPGWRITAVQTTPFASAETNAAGQFTFEKPPAGEYGIRAVWPDGEESQGAGRPVEIAAGATITDVTVSLARALQLLEPARGAEVEPTVTLRWQEFPGISNFRVLLIDAGTTELVLQQDASGTSLPVEKGLSPGRKYEVVVNGLGPDQELLATVSSEFRTAGTASSAQPETYTLPARCYQDGLPVYVDRQRGLCFAVPYGFIAGETEGGLIELIGPAAGEGLEPLFASLTVETIPYQGNDLPVLVDEHLKQFEGMPFDIKRTEMTAGDLAAIMLEPVPGRLSSRQVWIDHAPQNIYILTFWPSFADTAPEQMNAEMLKAEEDVSRLFEIVTKSLTMLPPDGVPLVGGVDVPQACAVDEQLLYLNTPDRYCFAIPQGFGVRREATGQPGIYGRLLDTSLEPERVTLGFEVEVAARDKTLEQIVDGYVAQFADVPVKIERSSTTLGGEPAIVLDGVPGRGSSWEAFVLRDGTLFHLRMQPTLDEASPRATPGVEALLESLASSFSFIK